MFNLLVKTQPWDEGRHAYDSSRVLSYTSDSIKDIFSVAGVFDFAKMVALPTLFVEETQRGRQQAGKIGRIFNVRLVRNEVTFEYLLDPDINSIPQSELIRLASSFELEFPRRGFDELSTTHWAIKDVDLFRILFRECNSANRIPKVFNLSASQEVQVDQLSAMMPFAGFGPVYSAIERASAAVGMRCNRADNVWDHHEIIQDIVSLIDNSAVVVCDLTGRNPNVFYEIGIAHTLGKEVVLITQNAADVPFDLAHLRHIRYLNNNEGMQALELNLIDRLRTIRANL